MPIPVQDRFLWIVRSQFKARWDENRSEAKFAAAECQWKWKQDRGILKFSERKCPLRAAPQLDRVSGSQFLAEAS
jgi:hypothetical protein